MKELFSLPWYTPVTAEYPDLDRACGAVGCDGVELVWGGEPRPPEVSPDRVVGYHLTFWPNWLDFWRGDEAALTREFGSRKVWEGFYGGSDGRETLLAGYRADLDRAEALGAEYVVYHVSDVSLEEGYTYRWQHSCREVVDGALEVLGILLSERERPFELLVENQWWPGFTFDDPDMTRRLLEGIPTDRKGILLDTGHLMNCAPELKSQAEGAAWLAECLDRHGELCRWIKGVHLHQSLSGGYVRAHTGALPEDWEETGDYYDKFGRSYGHILRIDTHRPWTDPAIAPVLARISPRYLIHELAADSRTGRERAILTQRNTLERGEFYRGTGEAAAGR